MLSDLQTMKLILNQHKQNLQYYKDTNNSAGVALCERYVFDWQCRISVVEMFGGN